MQMAIRSVICTIDFSPTSPLVIHYGSFAAQRLGVPLYLFHAVNHPQDGVHQTALFERGGDLSQLQKDARQWMQELMTHTQLDWEAVVRFGDPVEQMVDYTNRHPLSLVIAASYGVSRFRRLFIGTVVERLSRALSCPLLVVKPGSRVNDKKFDGFNDILIGCDEHGCWHRLSALLSRLRSKNPFRIHLARSVESPVDIIELDEETAPYSQAQQKLQARLEGVLWHEGKRVFPTADELSANVTPGVPQEMMMHAVEEMKSDLIVVGARHSGKVGRMISGSTTETLLRRSPCDVLVFPESSERDFQGRDP